MRKTFFNGFMVAALGAVLAGCSKSAPAPRAEEPVATQAPMVTQAIVQTTAPAPAHTESAPAPQVEAPAVPTEVTTNDAYQQGLSVLMSTNSTFKERQAVLAQMKAAGKLADLISDLRKQATENPDSAEIPALMGEAMLQSISPDMEMNQKGILAMGADQQFDAALKADPNNWEANYYKAASLSHWPPGLNKGDEVQQRFNDLIDTQEKAATPLPEYVRSYVVYGDYFQSIGNKDAAKAVWQRGVALFPNDPALTKRLSGQ